jgi:hypothetical protein
MRLWIPQATPSAAGGGKRLTSQNKTAGVIRERERIAVLVISQQGLAFVVGTPELIGPQSLNAISFFLE